MEAISSRFLFIEAGRGIVKSMSKTEKEKEKSSLKVRKKGRKDNQGNVYRINIEKNMHDKNSN